MSSSGGATAESGRSGVMFIEDSHPHLQCVTVDLILGLIFINHYELNCHPNLTLMLPIPFVSTPSKVMLLKNIDVAKGLVNGARGVVIGFEPNEAFPGWGPLPKVRFMTKICGGNDRSSVATPEPAEWSVELGGAPVAQRLQVPLRLAYAISIHKAQGM